MSFRAGASRLRHGLKVGKTGTLGALRGYIAPGLTLRGGLTASLKGAIAPVPALAGGLSLKRALAGAIPGGATFTSNLSGGPGQLRGAIPHAATISGGLAKSLRGSVSAAATIVGSVSKLKALMGNVPGAATFTSALTGAGGMPSGALGVWYAKDYDATKKLVPNAVAAAPTQSNLLRFSRRLFSNSDWAGGFNSTRTDNYATAPDGTNDASRLNVTANAGYLQVAGPSHANGETHTVSIWVKSNTGGNQDFRISLDFGGTDQTFTATTAWQRFTRSQTFGSSGGTTILIRAPAAALADLQICDLELFSGSDPGQSTPVVGHLLLGNVSGNQVPTYANGVLDFSSSGLGLIQLPSPRSINRFTVVAVAKKAASSGGYSGILAIPGGSYNQFAIKEEDGGQSGMGVNGVTILTDASGLWQELGQGWRGIGGSYDGTTAVMYRQDKPIFNATGTMTSTSIVDLYVNALNNVGTNGKSQIAGLALFNRALTQTEYTAAFNDLVSKANAAGASITNTTRWLATMGDSITFSSASYVAKYKPNASPIVTGWNYAAGGATLTGANSATAQAAIIKGSVPTNRGTEKYIASVLIGANDGPAWGTATAYAAALGAFCQDLKTNGIDKVALCCILPRAAAGAPGFNAWRNSVNAIIAGSGWAAANGVDVVVRFDLISGVGADADAEDTSKYSDGLHPTDATYVLMEGDATNGYRAAINAL